MAIWHVLDIVLLLALVCVVIVVFPSNQSSIHQSSLVPDSLIDMRTEEEKEVYSDTLHKKHRHFSRVPGGKLTSLFNIPLCKHAYLMMALWNIFFLFC